LHADAADLELRVAPAEVDEPAVIESPDVARPVRAPLVAEARRFELGPAPVPGRGQIAAHDDLAVDDVDRHAFHARADGHRLAEPRDVGIDGPLAERAGLGGAEPVDD